MHVFIINSNDAEQRVDKFILKTIKDIPVSLVYKAIRTKKIKVNRKRTEPSAILQEGDTVQIFLSDDFFLENQADAFKNIKNPKLDIVYEDSNIILCNKAAGQSVHSDEHTTSNTLIDHIKAYLYLKNEYCPQLENSFVPALCNRIDKNTSGIVIAAKNAKALRIMNQKIRDNQITKYYLCAVHGHVTPPSAVLTGYLLKNDKTNTVKVLKHRVDGAKKIITKYNVLCYREDLTLLEIELVTGRTHQIRAHMASIGYPLLGEGKYGINKEDRKLGYNHQALVSYKLVFNKTKEENDLSYLEGKHFEISTSHLSFMKLFEMGREV